MKNKLYKKILACFMTLLCLTIIPQNLYASQQTDEELLKLRNAKKTTNIATKAISNEVDEVYLYVMNEENYVVEIINSLSKIKTNRLNWEYNLKFLENRYSDIKMMDINLDYIDSYIEAYNYVLLSKKMPLEKNISSFSMSTRSTFSIQDAIDYATNYYDNDNYNPAYPDWTSYGGDCANFISQCLYAGGKTMQGTPGSTSEAQDFSNWFSQGSSCDTTKVSSTWRGADAFKHYWKSNASSYKTFSSYSSETYDYGYRGDAVSLLLDTGRAYHTMMVYAYSNGDLRLTAHTSSTISASLESKGNAASGGFIIYSTHN